MTKPSEELTVLRASRAKALLAGLKSTNFKSMTQVEVAEEMGISPIVLNAKLNGKRTLTETDAKIIANLFPPIRYQWILGQDDFETEAQQRLFPPIKSILSRKWEEQAVSAFLGTFNLAFGINSSPTDQRMTADEFANLPPEQLEKILVDADEFMKSNHAYSLAEIKTGKCLALFGAGEYRAFVRDVNEYVEFKLNKLIERSSDNNG